MADFFSPDELAQLREHGIVIFADRVIFDARPPMSPGALAEVEAACAGPVPPQLVALWQQTAGGALDYDLTLRMNGSEEAVNWSELFSDSSDGFYDLTGWINFERSSAAKANGEDTPPQLMTLPFGGFEDSDRIYTVTKPGTQFGSILAWKRGMPATWPHAMHEDGLATIATDLKGALAALHLSEDPLEPAGDYFTGQALMDYVDERHGDHGLDLDLCDKLIAFYRRALIDWRTPLANGELARAPLTAQIALRHAIATDDPALVDELAAAGVSFDAPLHGTAIATDLALAHGAYAAAAALVDAGAPVSADAMDCIEGAISPELTLQLLAKGAQPTAHAVAQCVACGAPDAARLIAQAYAKMHDDLPAAFEDARNELLEDLESSLAAVRTDEISHHLGAEGLAERIEHLKSFEL
ncbi:SMI1/KNR4 family protein [Variovorax sp. J22R133]|uniref:SMI1/KNR4 family protein n=1 Tax=Variovorax brevis TaxID=3053503 RepID=UPI002576EBB7|nr:SMI1/KNR4 family protein [Variovorax sp. J22R133]MDM0113013.1 SMI1/KNR4 family protein [Variovorax sp. J22R133]